jgi:pimeloyl-ACP methyl ester carboxylesterase
MTSLAELPTKEENPLPLWPGETGTYNGHQLFVRHAGTPGAEPAVFVHGLGGASSNWTDLMGLLAPLVDGYAPDLPGFGESAPPPRALGFSLATHVAAVVGVIESVVARTGQPVHLWGNSLGGAIAVRIARTRPELVRSLSLVSPALPYLINTKLDWRIPLMSVPGLGSLLQRGQAAQGPKNRGQALLELVCAHPERLHPLRRREAIEDMRARAKLPYANAALMHSLRGLLRVWADVGSGGLWSQAGGLRDIPILLVHGTQDRLVPVAVTRRLRRALPRAHVLELEEVGHVAMLEEPALVARAWVNMRELP